MPQVLTRRERQEQTRDRLLDAATKVFARRGYHEASVEEIAAEAGFTTGAVYSNFAGKEELFLALAEREVTHRVAEIRAVAHERMVTLQQDALQKAAEGITTLDEVLRVTSGDTTE